MYATERFVGEATIEHSIPYIVYLQFIHIVVSSFVCILGCARAVPSIRIVRAQHTNGEQSTRFDSIQLDLRQLPCVPNLNERMDGMKERGSARARVRQECAHGQRFDYKTIVRTLNTRRAAAAVGNRQSAIKRNIRTIYTCIAFEMTTIAKSMGAIDVLSLALLTSRQCI